MSAVVSIGHCVTSLRISSSTLQRKWRRQRRMGSLCHFEGLVPIEVDTGARNVRFNREMVFDRKRTRNTHRSESYGPRARRRSLVRPSG